MRKIISLSCVAVMIILINTSVFAKNISCKDATIAFQKNAISVNLKNKICNPKKKKEDILEKRKSSLKELKNLEKKVFILEKKSGSLILKADKLEKISVRVKNIDWVAMMIMSFMCIPFLISLFFLSIYIMYFYSTASRGYSM